MGVGFFVTAQWRQMGSPQTVEVLAGPRVLNALCAGDDFAAVDLERETLATRHRVLAVPSHDHASERIRALELRRAERSPLRGFPLVGGARGEVALADGHPIDAHLVSRFSRTLPCARQHQGVGPARALGLVENGHLVPVEPLVHMLTLVSGDRPLELPLTQTPRAARPYSIGFW